MAAEDRATELIKLRDDMKTDRVNFDNMYQDVSDLIFPQRAHINSETAPGTEQTQDIFDSTATNAAFVAAAATQGSIVPSTAKWFSMRLAPRDLEDIEGVPEWLFQLGNVAYNTINGSNFQTEIQEVFLDLFGYGTGCLFTGQRSLRMVNTAGFRGLHFKSTQPGHYVIGENEDGLVNSIFRDFKLNAHSIVSMFGEDKAPDKVKQAIEKNMGYMMFTVSHHVSQRENIDPDRVRPNAPALKQPFQSIYIFVDEPMILHEGGFFEFPYQVPRWSKMSGEIYGRGPGINSMPDIRTLNRAMELGLGAWEKAIDPPMEVMHRAIMGNIDMRARGFTMVREPNALRPIGNQIRYDAHQFQVADMRTQIQKAFFIDQIQLPPMGAKTPASATEVASRIETMQRILGPTFGRIQFELFNPMLGVVASLLIREGMVPPMPEELADAIKQRGIELEFEYEGPLTRAQQFQDVENIQKVMGVLGQLAAIFPEVLSYVNPAEVGKAILSSSSLPPAITRSDEEVQDLQQAQAQAQAQQAMMQGIETMGGAMKDMAPLLQEGIEPVI